MLMTGFKLKAVQKFMLFLLLQGIFQPNFQEFDYFWATDVIGIPLSLVNIQWLYMGIFAVVLPPLYQKYFSKWNYVNIFVLSQVIYLTAESINACLTLGLNKYVGIPNIVLYFLGGSFANSFDMGGIFFLSCVMFSRMTPPGIESTMYSVMDGIFVLCFMVLKSYTGVFVNKTFVNVTNDNI